MSPLRRFAWIGAAISLILLAISLSAWLSPNTDRSAEPEVVAECTGVTEMNWQANVPKLGESGFLSAYDACDLTSKHHPHVTGQPCSWDGIAFWCIEYEDAGQLWHPGYESHRHIEIPRAQFDQLTTMHMIPSS